MRAFDLRRVLDSIIREAPVIRTRVNEIGGIVEKLCRSSEAKSDPARPVSRFSVDARGPFRRL
jgi:hypothetical protein